MHVLMESTPRGLSLPADHHRILHEVDTCLADDFDLGHSTVQVEHISRPLESDAHA